VESDVPVRNMGRPTNADGIIQLDVSTGAKAPYTDPFGSTVFKTDKATDASVMKMGTPPVGKWQKVFSSASDIGKKTVPYASNIINSFRKIPQATPPTLIDRPAPANISLENSRVDIGRAVRGQNLNADRTLDANTAAAVRMGSMAQGMTALNGVNTAEANQNASARQQASQLGAGIDIRNSMLVDAYHNNQTEGQVAQTRNQAANLANAADKFIEQQNNDNRMKLDGQKYRLLVQQFGESGVSGRLLTGAGMELDPKTGLPIDKPVKQAMGGKLKKVYN
jgi:hypothetical protein